MSNSDQAVPQDWSENNINRYIRNTIDMPAHYEQTVRAAMQTVRDDYEAERRTDKARIAELETENRLLHQHITTMDSDTLQVEEENDERQ